MKYILTTILVLLIISVYFVVFQQGNKSFNSFPTVEIASTNDSLPELVLVEGDTFISVTRDVKKKKIVSDFYMSTTPITVRQFELFIQETGYKTMYELSIEGQFKYYLNWITGEKHVYYPEYTWKKDISGNLILEAEKEMPVLNISYYDAYAYCLWLSKKLNKKIDLPTDAEWEFAARGGKLSRNYIYSGSNILEEVVTCRTQDNIKTYKPFPVKGKKPNELGLYDMGGNISEMVKDCYDWQLYRKTDTINTLINPSRNLEDGVFDMKIINKTITNLNRCEKKLYRGTCGFLVFNDIGTKNALLGKAKYQMFKIDNTSANYPTYWHGNQFSGFRIVARLQ